MNISFKGDSSILETKMSTPWFLNPTPTLLYKEITVGDNTPNYTPFLITG